MRRVVPCPFSAWGHSSNFSILNNYDWNYKYHSKVAAVLLPFHRDGHSKLREFTGIRLKFSLLMFCSYFSNAYSRHLPPAAALFLLSVTTKSLLLKVMFIYYTLLRFWGLSAIFSSIFFSFSAFQTCPDDLGDLIFETISRECTLVTLETRSSSTSLCDFSFSRGETMRMISFSIGFSGESLCS